MADLKKYNINIDNIIPNICVKNEKDTKKEK
jgi:hypothetical protein